MGLHIALWRAAPSNTPRIRLLGILGLAGLVASGAIVVMVQGWDLYALTAAIWINTFCVTLYVFFYAGLSRSVSVTVLERLLASPTHRADFATLVADYSASARFEDRVRLMDHTGLVTIDSSGTVVATLKGIRLGRAAQFLGRSVGGGLHG